MVYGLGFRVQGRVYAFLSVAMCLGTLSLLHLIWSLGFRV
jgi:hypothetical protein